MPNGPGRVRSAKTQRNPLVTLVNRPPTAENDPRDAHARDRVCTCIMVGDSKIPDTSEGSPCLNLPVLPI